jgi:hypothetical protein
VELRGDDPAGYLTRDLTLMMRSAMATRQADSADKTLPWGGVDPRLVSNTLPEKLDRLKKSELPRN